MGWVKLERGDDWGHIYFALPGKRLNENGYTCARTQALDIPEGETYRVRWPSGEETSERVKYRRGHEGVHPVQGFEVIARGLQFWVPADAVEIWLEGEGI